MNARQIMFVIVAAIALVVGATAVWLSVPRSAEDFEPRSMRVTAAYPIGPGMFAVQAIVRGDMPSPYLRLFAVTVTGGTLRIASLGGFDEQMYMTGITEGESVFMVDRNYVPAVASSQMLFKLMGPEVLRVDLVTLRNGTRAAIRDDLGLTENGMVAVCRGEVYIEKTSQGKTILYRDARGQHEKAVELPEPVTGDIVCLDGGELFLPALDVSYFWDGTAVTKTVGTLQNVTYGDAPVVTVARKGDGEAMTDCTVWGATAGQTVPVNIPACAQAVAYGGGQWYWSVAERTYSDAFTQTANGVEGLIVAATRLAFMTRTGDAAVVYDRLGGTFGRLDFEALKPFLPPPPAVWPPPVAK